MDSSMGATDQSGWTLLSKPYTFNARPWELKNTERLMYSTRLDPIFVSARVMSRLCIFFPV